MLLTAGQVLKHYNITSQTLYNWRRLGKIKYFKTPAGSYRYYPVDYVEPNRRNVIYARVSNTKQKDDLVRQIELLQSFMNSRGVVVSEIYSEIASGMNEDRKQFNKLIQECVDGNIKTIYITYRDRFTRFGFEYFVKFLKKLNVDIVVINETESTEQSLTEDLISIIHYYSMKMYSGRRKKFEKFTEELEKSL